MSNEITTQELTAQSIGSKSSLFFSFRISDDFLETYRNKKAPFGYRDAGGNSVGEITFLRTY